MRDRGAKKMIERPSSDRVKTGERDAQRLLRLLMIEPCTRFAS